MRAAVDSREADQQRNRKARQTNSPARESKNSKERGRSNDVPGRESVIFGAQTRTVPRLFRFHGRPGTTGCNFNGAPGQSGDRERDQHQKENARPFLVATPPHDAGKNKPKRKMFRPIAETAHVAHEIAHAGSLVARDKIAHDIVKIERSRNCDRSHENAERPIENGALLHKVVPVSDSTSYSCSCSCSQSTQSEHEQE